MDHYSIAEAPGKYAGEHPVAANTVIKTGGLVAKNAAGDSVPGDGAVASVVTGRAAAGADNTGGDAGDINVLVERGIYILENDDTDTLTKAHIGKPVYATAPDTVGNGATESDCPAGLLLGFDPDDKPIVDTTQAAEIAERLALDARVAVLEAA